MFEKLVIVDGRGHLLGRLASILAKELLNGQKVVVVRCEEINISGSLFRNKLKYASFIRKRTNTNPTRGPWHYRAPSRILWRVIRGMVPHKTDRAKIALERLKVYEGVPHPFDRMKRVLVPSALRVIRLRPGRRYCKLGDLSSAVGWKHQELISSLESKRKVKSASYYKKKLIFNKLRNQAINNTQQQTAEINKKLQQLGQLLPDKQSTTTTTTTNTKTNTTASKGGKKQTAADDEE